MKVPGVIVATLMLTALLSAQSNLATSAIPPRVLRTAELIGVRSELAELMELRAKTAHDEMREMHLVQRLQGIVMASTLDVESVNARIDYEVARLQEVQTFLSARRDRRVNLLNVGNLLIGSGVGAVGSGLQLIGPAQHAGNIVSTSAGFGGTILSVLGLRQQRGQMRAPGYTPAMLAELLGGTPPPESSYPADVWAYLTTPDPALPQGFTGQQHLMFEWTSFGHLKEKPDAKTIAALSSTSKDGTPLSIDVIGDRTAMLEDVRAHVGTMLVDLAEMMRFVVAEK